MRAVLTVRAAARSIWGALWGRGAAAFAVWVVPGRGEAPSVAEVPRALRPDFQ